MQEVKLTIKNPPIIGYLHHAYLLSVAQEHPYFEEWFYNNYLQMRYYPEVKWLNFYRMSDEDYCPLISLQKIRYSLLKSNRIEIVDFIEQCISNGYYVSLNIDEYYDPNRESYNRKQFIHENLIFGFNTSGNYLYSAGFNREKNYSYSRISFKDFSDAVSAVKEENTLKIMRPEANVVFKLDIENVKNILTDYLNSGNTSLRNRMYFSPTTGAVYGLEIFKHLKTYYQSLMDDEVPSDFQILHIQWEHTKCMAARIKFLHKQGYIKDINPAYQAFTDIAQHLFLLRNMHLKYTVTKDAKIIRKIIDALDAIEQQEAAALENLIAAIS